MGATPRQLDTIDSLVRQLGIEGDAKAAIYQIARMPDARPAGEVRDLISGLIERARRQERAPRAANAEPGYYVRADGAAIVVVQNKEKTRTYGKLFTPRPGRRPQWVYERGLGISVAELTPMSAAAAAALGLSHGHCIFCCAPLGGDTLSAAVSAKIGYGETCAGHQALPYPRGRAAQQAFLDGAS